MRHFVSAAFGLWLGVAGQAMAEQASPVVVELYTSQGCSSCPPADDFMAKLAQMPGVIALSLHVDYWDYIGWKDNFAQSRFTDRQKAYARAIGSRTIYTPQLIVGGRDRIEGNQPDAVVTHIAEQHGESSGVSLQIARKGGKINIDATAQRALPRPARVQLVRYLPKETVTIERGENAGKTVTYYNVVTSWQVLGEWDGRTALDISADLPGSEPAVVILQAEGPGEIFAAAAAK